MNHQILKIYILYGNWGGRMRKKAMIFIFLALASIVLLTYLFFSFNRPVDYFTREPVYHEYFPIGLGHARVFQLYQGNALILLRCADGNVANLIINIETGRELMRFQDNGNRRMYFINLLGDETVWVRRSSRTGIFNRTMIHEYALLDIESERELIPFDSEHNRLRHVSGGLAIVGDPEHCRGYYGVIEIDTGMIKVPFEYKNIKFLSDNLVAASIEDIYGYMGETWGVIDGRTGETIWPFHYRSIFSQNSDYFPLPPRVDGGRNYVRFNCVLGEVALIDITTGEVIIPACSQNRLISVGYGMAVQREWPYTRLIEIESGRELIPFGQFSRIYILNENAVRVSNRMRIPIYMGVINVNTGETVVPAEGYQLLPGHREYYANGMILMVSGDERAIIDVASGEQIIPFGTYNIHQLLSGGFITVSEGDYWRIMSIS